MREDEKKIGKIILGTFGTICLIILLFGFFYTIPAGHRGILLTFGKPNDIAMNEGLGFKMPLAQKVIKMEVRTQKIEVPASSASLDLQSVDTTIALNYHLLPESVPKLYKEIGTDYRSRIINPIIQETVKSVTAKYKAEELITKRQSVRDDIKNVLRERLQTSSIILDDFNIVNFQFSAEFNKAIEEKVTAEQLKLKAERDLERIVIEKEQKITQAQAEAESLRLQKQEVTQELIQLRQIEMMMSAIAKWDGKMPEATSGMPFIDVTPKKVIA